MKANVISQAVTSSLQNLTNSRLQEIMSEVSSMAGNNNYAEAKQAMQSEASRLQQEIRSIIAERKLRVLPEIFTARVYPSGMKGFQELTQTLRNNGCSLSIRFNPSGNLPSCPW